MVMIAENEAFLLTDKETREMYESAYRSTRTLYYQSQPDFDDLLEKIEDHVHEL